MNLDNEQLKKIRGLILYTIVVAVLCFHYKEVLAVLGRGFNMIFPFLLGCGIAFILNVPMRRIESLMGGKDGRKKRWHRPVSLLVTILLVLGIVAVVIFIVVPQVAETAMSLSYKIPSFANQVGRKLEQLFADEPQIAAYLAGISINWKEVFNGAVDFVTVGAGSVLSTTFSAAMSIASGFTTFVIAFVFSIYILLQKETLKAQFKKLFLAILPQKAAERFFEMAALTEKTFSSFLAGQCLEAVILGTMFFVAMTIVRMNYALLMGVLIAFTALIPIFGAFIGCAIGVFLMLMESPMSALAFIVLFNVLQQIEGNLIYPRVVGGSVGLPSIWVLVAVTLGASMMGIAGMLLFIPTCSVLYNLLKRAVNSRLEEKKKNTAGS